MLKIKNNITPVDKSTFRKLLNVEEMPEGQNGLEKKHAPRRSFREKYHPLSL
jgi:hypothetical protein